MVHNDGSGERGEKIKVGGLWKKHSKKKIWFEYNPECLNTNSKHWWIIIQSPQLENIRLEAAQLLSIHVVTKALVK